MVITLPWLCFLVSCSIWTIHHTPLFLCDKNHFSYSAMPPPCITTLLIDLSMTLIPLVHLIHCSKHCPLTASSFIISSPGPHSSQSALYTRHPLPHGLFSTSWIMEFCLRILQRECKLGHTCNKHCVIYFLVQAPKEWDTWSYLIFKQIHFTRLCLK